MGVGVEEGLTMKITKIYDNHFLSLRDCLVTTRCELLILQGYFLILRFLLTAFISYYPSLISSSISYLFFLASSLPY